MSVNILLKILMFILMMIIINIRTLIDIFVFERRQSKAWYIIANAVSAIIFFYMLFVFMRT